ncbi:MAG: hypothetical protein ACRDU5_20555 [Mycobacterium sp.]
MRTAIRPYLTTGVALVGSSVIAVAPIAAAPPDIKIANPNVQSAAVENPFAFYEEVFERTVANIEALLELASNPPATGPVPTAVSNLEDILGDNPLAPLLDGILDDPEATFEDFVASFEDLLEELEAAGEGLPALLEGVLDDLAAGDVEDAVNALLFATAATAVSLANTVAVPLLVPVLEPIVGPMSAPVVAQGLVTSAILGFGGPLISGPGAGGTALQGVIDALDSGDPEDILGALIDGPAIAADGVLNGGYGPNLAVLTGMSPPPPGPDFLAGGILSPGTTTTPSGAILPGPIATGIGLVQQLQLLLDPPETMTSITSAPGDEGLRTLTVPTDQGLEEGAGAQDGGTPPVTVQTPPEVDPEDTEKSNQDALAKDVEGNTGNTGNTGLSGGPRIFGTNPAAQGGGTGLNTLGEGIRDGINSAVQGFRDAVDTVTGRGGSESEPADAP